MAYDSYVPPLLPYWLALSISVFGDSPFIMKLSMLPFIVVFVMATYALGKRFSPSVAMPLTFFLALSPAILPSWNIMLDLPSIALGLLAVELFMRSIDSGDWKKATRQLNQVVEEDDNNADAWNLLGYSWCKLDENRKSSKAYARALKINPEHKGALEYQGELFIKLGELEKAKGNLELLRDLCPEGCSEREDLANALAGKSTY